MRRGVLVVTPYLPWPPRHGGRIRTLRLLEGLVPHCEVSLVCGLGESDREAGMMALTNMGFRVSTSPLRPRPPRNHLDRFVKACRAVGGRSYMLPRWYDPHFAAALAIEARSGYDLVVLDHLWMAPYLPVLPAGPLLFNSHNVESRAVARAAKLERFPSSLMARREAGSLRACEARLLRRANATVAVTEDDAETYRGLAPQARVEVVANGAEVQRWQPVEPRERTQPPRLLFVGGYDYPPNLDAARNIAHEILPTIRRRHPDARVMLVGRDPYGDLASVHGVPGVEVMGQVERLEPLFRDCDAVLVPLRFGGGSRLKIVEAWARGRPVISTRVGAEGLDAENGRHLLLAETGEQFAHAFERLLTDAPLRESLVVQARQRAEDRHDWHHLAERFREICLELCEKRSAASAR